MRLVKLALLLLAACGGPGPARPADARATDAAAVDATAADAAIVVGAWPRTAGELRAALGGRGRWTSAWQLDEASGDVADALGASTLAAIGSLDYRRSGARSDDRAIGFDGRDEALVASVAPFALSSGRSLAALFATRIVAAPGGSLIASQRRDGRVGAVLLAVDPSTGHLRAALPAVSGTATAIIPIDHRDGTYHDVLVVIDREAGELRLLSDLGRSPPTAIVGLGEAGDDGIFSLGASAHGAAARQDLAFAAIATDDVAGLAAGGDDALHALRVVMALPAPIVRPPAGAPWLLPWPIRRDRRGRYTIDVDPHDLRIPTTTDLWISPTGDDAAAGTAAAPMRSLHAALSAMTTATTIHLAAGTYDAAAGWYGVAPAHDVNLIAEGGRARLSTATDDLPWRASLVGPGVFEVIAPGTPYTVIDGAAAAGVDPWLVRRATPAQVAATPGSWTAVGGLVTVHTLDGRAPDALVQVMPAATLNGQIDDPARSVYLEGLDLEGGYKALNVNRAHRLIVVDSTFRYGAGEGLSVRATDEVLAFGATAEANARDGLAYTTTRHVLEVGCAGRDNGRDGAAINNGSTTHDGASVIRIGGDYRDNDGPNVADVQGAWSWNLGTVAAGNRATATVQRVNFYIDGTMWLREADARDRPEDETVDLDGAGTSVLHLYDTERASLGGTGVVDERAE